MLFSSRINAQLFENKEFYPNIKTVKVKYNGSFWGIAKLDTQGRTIEKKDYYKRKFWGKSIFIYNFNNDKLYEIVTFNIDNDNPKQIDTIEYKYQYQGNRIVYQKRFNSKNDSTVIRLIDNQADTILIYQSKSYYFRPQTNTTDIYEKRYTLKYRDELLVHSEEFDLNRDRKEIAHFEYYPNGMLKRKKTEIEPKLQNTIGYFGGEESYEYEFDKFGQVKIKYYLTREERYRSTTYKYIKR